VTVSLNAGTMGDRGQGNRAGGSIMGDIDGLPQDASIGLSPGDTVSIEDLLYGMLLDSGNDAAIALAESRARTESAFVARMNARAVKLGLGHTHYANPHGRDPSRIDPDNCPDVVYDGSDCAHHSSPRDLATLAIKALSHPLFAQIVNTPTYNTRLWSAQASGAVDSGLDNSNDLIRRDKSSNPYLYTGAIGIKTGTTDAAGACLVAGADSKAHPEDSVVTVVLGAANDNDRYIDSVRLLDFGFAVLEHRRQTLTPTRQPNPQIQGR
jgi:D-alanyl-D-alanine carboxypeptidase